MPGYDATVWRAAVAGETVAVRMLRSGAAHARLNATGVCHMDFQPFNVLSDGALVTGIVDWSRACRADPRIDVACTRVILELAPVLLPGQPADAFTDARARGYASVGTLPYDR